MSTIEPNNSLQSANEVDVEALMAEIRQKVKSSLGNASARFPASMTESPAFQSDTSQPIVMAEELSYLNANWRGWPIKPELSTHRPLLGKFFVKFKRYLLELIWNVFFAEYFRREEKFNQQLVRYLNKQAKYSDARDAEIFWQLINKLDCDINALNKKCDNLHDEIFVALEKLEKGER